MSKPFYLQVCKRIDGYMYQNYVLEDWDIEQYINQCKENNQEINEDSLLEYLCDCIYEENLDLDHEEYMHTEGLNEFLNKCKEYDITGN